MAFFSVRKVISKVYKGHKKDRVASATLSFLLVKLMDSNPFTRKCLVTLAGTSLNFRKK